MGHNVGGQVPSAIPKYALFGLQLEAKPWLDRCLLTFGIPYPEAGPGSAKFCFPER